MVEAVLCDIDGTLVESNWLHAAAWKDAFAVVEIDLELDAIRQEIGKSGMNSFPCLARSLPMFLLWETPRTMQRPALERRESESPATRRTVSW
jgi:beta-phosphoglucomutase-like phosphatase (HAD superfamily)